MKRISILISLCLLVLTSCTDYNAVSIHSVGLESFKLESTTKAKVIVSAVVNNPTSKVLILEGVEGILYRDTVKFANINLLEPTSVGSKIEEKVNITTELFLIDPIALLSTGLNFRNMRSDEFKVDGVVTVRPEGGCKKKFRIKGVPVTQLFEYFK